MNHSPVLPSFPSFLCCQFLLSSNQDNGFWCHKYKGDDPGNLAIFSFPVLFFLGKNWRVVYMCTPRLPPSSVNQYGDILDYRAAKDRGNGETVNSTLSERYVLVLAIKTLGSFPVLVSTTLVSSLLSPSLLHILTPPTVPTGFYPCLLPPLIIHLPWFSLKLVLHKYVSLRKTLNSNRTWIVALLVIFVFFLMLFCMFWTFIAKTYYLANRKNIIKQKDQFFLLNTHTILSTYCKCHV